MSAGLLRAGLALILAALLLFGGGCQGKAEVSPVGVWHSDELGQMLRFHEDGTVVIRTAFGDAEATYVFDASSGRGVVTLNGASIAFTLEGETLTLTANGEEDAFVPGEMAIVAATPAASAPETAQAAAEAPPTSAPAATASETAPAGTPPPTEAAAPGGTDASGDVLCALVPDLTLMPAVSLSPSASQSQSLVLGSGYFTGGILAGVVGDSILGEWYCVGYPEYVMTFYEDGTCRLSNELTPQEWYYPYAYERLSGRGVLLTSDGSRMYIEVNGDVITIAGRTDPFLAR